MGFEHEGQNSDMLSKLHHRTKVPLKLRLLRQPVPFGIHNS